MEVKNSKMEFKVNKIYSSNELALTKENCPKINKDILIQFANNCEQEALKILRNNNIKKL